MDEEVVEFITAQMQMVLQEYETSGDEETDAVLVEAQEHAGDALDALDEEEWSEVAEHALTAMRGLGQWEMMGEEE